MKSFFSFTSGTRIVACLMYAATILCVLATVGCHGYRFGTAGLYNREIKTVYVPMVVADTYRDGLGERLTEAVCKRITSATPYDLADARHADSTLFIHLVAENQFVSALNKYNDTRQKNLVWSVIAVWKDNQHNVLGELDPIPLSTLGVSLSSQGYLVAEMGQSGAVTQQEVIDKLADQIVGLMEEKW